MVGTADSVLIREVYFIQSVFYREVPLYSMVEEEGGRTTQTGMFFCVTSTTTTGFQVVSSNSYHTAASLTKDILALGVRRRRSLKLQERQLSCFPVLLWYS